MPDAPTQGNDRYTRGRETFAKLLNHAFGKLSDREVVSLANAAFRTRNPLDPYTNTPGKSNTGLMATGTYRNFINATGHATIGFSNFFVLGALFALRYELEQSGDRAKAAEYPGIEKMKCMVTENGKAPNAGDLLDIYGGDQAMPMTKAEYLLYKDEPVRASNPEIQMGKAFFYLQQSVQDLIRSQRYILDHLKAE